MSTKLADSEDMFAAAAEASNSQTILGYHYTQNPAVQGAKKLIEEGVIGRVIGFYGSYDVDNEADPDLPLTHIPDPRGLG